MKLLLFSRETCGSCRRWKPVIYRISEELGIPIEETGEKEEMRKYSVNGLPTTILFDDDGNEVYNILGNMREDKALIDLRKVIDGRGD